MGKLKHKISETMLAMPNTEKFFLHDLLALENMKKTCNITFLCM